MHLTNTKAIVRSEELELVIRSPLIGYLVLLVDEQSIYVDVFWMYGRCILKITFSNHPSSPRIWNT